MKTTANYIVLHPSAHKIGGGGGAAHRALVAIIALVFIFTLTSTLNTKRDAAAAKSQLSDPISTPSGHMSPAEIESVASVLRRCGAAPCNLLVFGLTQDTLFWNSVNRGGRTVFVGESSYFVSKFEEKNPSIEAYDVQFTTRAGELYDLIEDFKREIRNECRPVQNLLFSDCKLAVNDLPNHLYDVAWDVILIDGPRGYSAETPGRMAPIFTAGVLARSGKGGGGGGTHVFVHEIEREVEKVCSDLFLCRENLEEEIDSLGHFLVGKMADNNRNGVGFCDDSPLSTELI